MRDTTSRVAPLADAATTDRLTAALEAILPALEEFDRFRGPDRAAPRSSWRPALDEPLPAVGVGADAVLAILRDRVIPHGLRTGHPGFSGWVTTAPTTIATAAGLAAMVASPQRWWVQSGNHLDSMAVDWMLELLGFPSSHVGTFTSGGSTANLVGIGVARQHAAERLGLDASAAGIAAIPSPVTYATVETHHVVHRALGVLGLGRRSLRTIPLDHERRMDVAALRSAIEEDEAAGRTPIAIVGNAGDVNTGIVDDLPALAGVAREHGVWFHVDGAYGGFGLLDPRVRDRYGDPATYDSFAVDPHKWMAVPVGTGFIACRDGDLNARAFTIEPGEYDRERRGHADDGSDPESPWESTGSGTPDWGVDFSTPTRGMAVWAVLKEIGAEGMIDRIGRHLDCARRVAERVRGSEELELLAEPELSICCFRYRPTRWSDPDLEERIDALNAAVLRGLRQRGRSLPSATRVDGRYAIRACFINPRTTLVEADTLVDEVLTVGRQLAGSAWTART
jgi:aromatic-L-amino-acid decarboxylase